MDPETFITRINFSSNTKRREAGLTRETCMQGWSPGPQEALEGSGPPVPVAVSRTSVPEGD